MLDDGRKLKITFLTYRPALSGGARVIGDYATHLLRRGHDVRVFAQPETPPPLLRRLKSRLGGKPEWKPRESPFFEPLGERFSRLSRPGAPRAEDLPDADVIVANFWITATWIAGLPASKGAKAFFMQDYGAAGQPIEDVRRTWGIGLKMITISRYLRNEIAASSGARSILVPCGVDPGFLIDEQRNARTGPPTVGFVYSNNVMKGSSVCLAAIEKARAVLPNLRVVAFGPKPPETAGTLPAYVDFKANVSEAQACAIYGACDAWLFGSLREGFGLPILEAMAAGTPVIAANSAAAPEILEHGGGRLVPAGDADAMAQALIEVLALQAPEWCALSRQAFSTAQRFSLEVARTRFENALLAIADGRFAEVAAAS